MEKFSYRELLHRLERFDGWLTSLGLTPHPTDRIHKAISTLRKADQATRQGRELENYSYIEPEDWFLMIEAFEAHDVFAAFENDHSPEFTRELKKALRGASHAINEGSNQNNSDGRNIWFELALAAEWRLRGASVSVNEPDLRLTREGVEFLVACKRPASHQSIGTNIRGAVGQLQRNLDKSQVGVFGVAALSLSRVFNRGDKVFSGETQGLAGLLSDELGKHERYLLSVKDPRICGIIFHIATPGVGDEGTDLNRVSQTLAWDLNNPTIGSKAFQAQIRDMINYSEVR